MRVGGLTKSFGFIASAAAIAVAGCGGGGVGSSTTSDETAVRPPHQHRSRGAPLNVYPASMVPNPDAVVSDETMPRIKNGWTAEDHHQTTLVVAGAGEPPQTKGLFGVYRLRLSPFKTKTDLIEVRGAGTLRITRAPLGRKVARSAQNHGDLQFTSVNGITGTLHLKDDTVTLNR
jgi:hypothetical protein